MGYTSDFNNDTTYNASSINAIRATIQTKGVLNEHSESMKVTSVNSTSVKILAGQAVFGDGSRVVVDKNGVTLTISSGQHYIYAKREANDVRFYATTAAPTGDYVMLARATGTVVTDAREVSSFIVTRGLGNGYFVKKNETGISIRTSDKIPQGTVLYSEDTGSSEYIGGILSSEGSEVQFYGAFDFATGLTNGWYMTGFPPYVNCYPTVNSRYGLSLISNSSNYTRRISLEYVGTNIRILGENNFNTFDEKVSLLLY